MANPTSRTRGATNDYYQVEQERIEVNLSPKRPQLSPQHQCKIHLPGKRVLCQEKAKVYIRQNLIKLSKNWPKPRGHPRSSPKPSGHPRSNSFFGDNFAQEARRRKRGVFRDACPPGQPQQLPDAHRRQQWRPSPTESSFTAFTLASSRRGATTHGYQASISYLLILV